MLEMPRQLTGRDGMAPVRLKQWPRQGPMQELVHQLDSVLPLTMTEKEQNLILGYSGLSR